MGQNDVVWDLEPHTAAKHEILRYYLGAWFPILATVYARVVYVDGFAGPGEYKGGEPGSPIIALTVANEHMLQSRFRGELAFLFIEADKARADHLEKKISQMELPATFKYRVRNADFDKHVGEVLKNIADNGKTMAPSFFFIDPFGPSGFPMSLISKISEQPHSEVLINFSYQPLNEWFLSVESRHGKVDELFGNPAWRKALLIQDPKRKEDYLRQAYGQALEGIGWKVRPFSMTNKFNQTQYYLFFGTKSAKGMMAMKRAMWNAAPDGEFRYSDLSNPAQPSMFDLMFEGMHEKRLAESIYEAYKSTTATKEELTEYTSWDPICLDRHLTESLRIMEKSDPPKILSVEGRSRRGFYPNGCRITFAP